MRNIRHLVSLLHALTCTRRLLWARIKDCCRLLSTLSGFSEVYVIQSSQVFG